MVIWCLYAAILVVALLGVHLSSLIASLSRLDKIIRVFLILVAVHVVHAALFRDVFVGYKYVDRSAPYGLLYGPLLYFAYRVANGNTLIFKEIILHIIPFLFGLVAFSCFLIFADFRLTYDRYYYVALYGSMSLSWLIYPIVVIWSADSKHADTKWIYRYAIVILLILAAFMIPLVITGTAKGQRATSPTSGFVVFFSMFMGVCMVYFYLVNRINGTTAPREGAREDNMRQVAVQNSSNEPVIDTLKYQKYYARIEVYLRHERYLDPEFTIRILLQELRLPKPVVTAFFAEHYQGNIKQVINSLRIRKACELLQNDLLEYTMEELAAKCGFNSRASFYRNFSQEKFCTPLEYRDANLLDKRRNDT